MTGFLDRSICFQGWDLDLHHSPAAPSPNKLAPKTQNQKKKPHPKPALDSEFTHGQSQTPSWSGPPERLLIFHGRQQQFVVHLKVIGEPPHTFLRARAVPGRRAWAGELVISLWYSGRDAKQQYYRTPTRVTYRIRNDEGLIRKAQHSFLVLPSSCDSRHAKSCHGATPAP